MRTTDSAEGDPAATQWTSRSMGSSFQHQFFYRLIRYGGRQGAYCFLAIVVLFYVLFMPAVRRKAEHYLARRFSRNGALQRLADVYLLYFNFGKALIDRAVIGILGEERIVIEFEGQDVLIDLLGENRGLLLMTAHVGCWQTAMSALRFLQVPVHLLLHREEGDIDLHYFEHAGMANPFRIIDPKGFMGGVLDMVEVLKKNEVLCVMGDRLFGSRRGAVPVDFLGGRAWFPFGVFKVASVTGAPVAVVLSHKSGPDRHTLEVATIIRIPQRAGRGEGDFTPCVGEFAQTLESYTAAHPYQFFNFFDMWEETPETNLQRRGKRNDP